MRRTGRKGQAVATLGVNVAGHDPVVGDVRGCFRNLPPRVR